MMSTEADGYTITPAGKTDVERKDGEKIQIIALLCFDLLSSSLG
jgi:hypothetical protein